MSDRIDAGRSWPKRGHRVGIAAIGSAGGLLDACSSSPSSTSTTNTGTTRRHLHRHPKPAGRSSSGRHEEVGFSPTKGTYDEVGLLYARTVFDPS